MVPFLQSRCAGKGVSRGLPRGPTLDSDAGAAGHLPRGVLGQTGVGAIVLWEWGVLDVELGHASLAGGAWAYWMGCVLGGEAQGGLVLWAAGRGGGSPVLSRVVAVMKLGFPTLLRPTEGS